MSGNEKTTRKKQGKNSRETAGKKQGQRTIFLDAVCIS
jgi:hypothetical protein